MQGSVFLLLSLLGASAIAGPVPRSSILKARAGDDSTYDFSGFNMDTYDADTDTRGPQCTACLSSCLLPGVQFTYSNPQSRIIKGQDNPFRACLTTCTLEGKCWAAPSLQDTPQGSQSSLSADHTGHWSGSSHSGDADNPPIRQVFKQKPGQGAVIMEQLRTKDRFPGKPQGGASDAPGTPLQGQASGSGTQHQPQAQQPAPVAPMAPHGNGGSGASSPGSSSSGGCTKCLGKLKCSC